MASHFLSQPYNQLGGEAGGTDSWEPQSASHAAPGSSTLDNAPRSDSYSPTPCSQEYIYLPPEKKTQTLRRWLSGCLAQAKATLRPFSRSIGLAFLTLDTGAEGPKTVLTKSWRTSLARCGVHLLPAAVSMVIIIINLCNVYIGPKMDGPSGQNSVKEAVLQVCAKVHELLVVGSLASIIFHVLRGNLLHRSGVPLGLLGSGFAFSQLSFFWSPDFLGSLQYRDQSVRRKWLLLGLIILSGFLAIFAGPASAILMIPKNIHWAAGGTRFYLGDEHDMMWPTQLQAMGYKDCIGEDMWQNSSCPSAGFPSIYSRVVALPRVPYGNIYNNDFDIYDTGIRRRMYSFTSEDQTISTIAHAPTAHAMLASAAVWMSGLKWMLNDTASGRIKPNGWVTSPPDKVRFTTHAEVPFVRAACDFRAASDPDTKGYIFWPGRKNRTLTLDWPELQREGREMKWHTRTLTPSELGELRGRVNSMKHLQRLETIVVAMQDSEDKTGGTSMILLTNLYDQSMREENQDPWIATPCTVGAHWAHTTLAAEQDYKGDGYIYEDDHDETRVMLEFPERKDWGHDGFATPGDGSWRQINVKHTWFKVASPNSTFWGLDIVTNTLDDLLTAASQTDYSGSDGLIPEMFGSNILLMQNTLAIALVDTISRAAPYENFNYGKAPGPYPPPRWDRATLDDFVRVGKPSSKTPFDKPISTTADPAQLTMHAYMNGYVLAVSGRFDMLSITVLMIHAVLALAHTLWVVFRSQTTSDTWQSIPEMIVLAQHSQPPQGGKLANCSAGVWTWGAQKMRAWVEDSSGDPGGQEQLRLKFEDHETDWPRRNGPEEVKVGKKYGRKAQASGLPSTMSRVSKRLEERPCNLQ
ncbi:hypothetical protein CC79DRAFT_1374479 [Sarocladium strictum]